MIDRVLPNDVTRLLVLETARAPTIASRPSLALGFLDAKTLARHAADLHCRIGAALVAEHARGTLRCAGALDGRTLVGYAFYADGSVPARHNRGGERFDGIGLELPPGARFLFKAFVRPAWRGRGVLPALLVDAHARLRETGVHTIVTTTARRNGAARRALARAGFREVGTAAELVLFGRHLYRLPPPWPLAGTDGRAGEGGRGTVRLRRPGATGIAET